MNGWLNFDEDIPICLGNGGRQLVYNMYFCLYLRWLMPSHELHQAYYTHFSECIYYLCLHVLYPYHQEVGEWKDHPFTMLGQAVLHMQLIREV